MGQSALFDREFCEPLALLAAGSVCAATGGAAAAGFALFGAPAIALGAWSVTKWVKRLKNRSPNNARAVTKIQEALIQKLRGDGTLETIKPELRARLDTELPTLIAAHWPSPQRIAKLSGQGDGFPSAIAAYVLDEIDGSTYVDDLYEATTVRRFVRLVVETALDAALTDTDYFAAGQIKRDMKSFVSDLGEIKDILSEAVPAILERLDALSDAIKDMHAEMGDMHGKVDLLVAKIVGDARPSPEEAKQTEQSVADLLASDMRASRDAADILLSDGSAAATSRLKQGLAEQSDARLEATKNEIALLEQIAIINYYDNGPEAVDAYEKIVTLNADDIDTWNQLGLLRYRLGNLDRAKQAFQHVADLAGTRKDYAAIAYGNMGLVAQTRGDLDGAMRYYEQSLELDKELGRKEGMASGYGNMGNVAQTRGDLDGALHYLEQSFAIEKELGRKEGMANVYGNQGIVAWRRGDLDEAMHYYEQALALNEELGYKEGIANQYSNMGIVARTQGDLDGAMRYYEQSLALDKELGRKEGMARKYGNMGVVALTRGDLDGAVHYYEQALELDEALGHKEGMAVNYGNKGLVAETQGDADRAMRYYEQSLALHEELGHRAGMANQYNNMGNVAQARGDLESAIRYYEQALALNEAVGRKEGIAKQYGNIGIAAQMSGDLDVARENWERALALFTEVGAVPQIEHARHLIDSLPD